MSSQPAVDAPARVSLSERLQTVIEALAAARTQDEVFGVVLTPALEALDAVAGAVLLVDETGGRLEIAATQGYEEGAQTLWQDGPLDESVPAGDALEQREPLFFEQQGDLTRAYPELEARTGGVAAVATAVLPMFLDDRPLGVILLDFEEPHHFTPQETRFLRTLTAQCALALGRVQAVRRLEQRVEERTRELEAERTFLRTLLSSLGESIVACDAHGRLTLFNAVSQALHGQDAGPVPPHTWAEHYGLYQPDGVTPLAPAQVPLYRAWQGELVENAEIVVRPPSGEARTLLVNGQPILSERGERLGAVVAQRDITERQGQARDLAAARTRAEVLAALGDALQRAGSPEEVAALALDRIGPAVGARGMLVVRLEGEALRLPTVWGDVPEAITSYLNRPGRTLSDTTTFQHVVRSGQAVYLGGYHPRGRADPAFPILAAGVEPIRTPSGALGGFLVASRPVEAGAWQSGERDLLSRAAGTLGLALERAETARRLQERTAALDAFVAYKEAVGGESDVPTLARRAVQVVRANLEHVSAAYYELEGGLWQARVWSEDIPPEVVAQITAGVPHDAPNYAEAARRGAPLFVDGWDAAANGVPSGTSYGAAAFLPLLTGGEARSLFSVGTREARTWTEREKALVRAVARGLSVTLERTEQTRQLEAEREALAAFARFTEGSTHTTDALTLARGAKDVLLAALGVEVGYSELEDGLWKGRVFSETTPPEVMAQARKGFPADLPGFARPFQERDVVFVDGWDPQGAEQTEVYGAAALYPYFEDGTPRGLLTMGTSQARAWTERERSVFRSVGRSLGLALERAEQARHLQARTDQEQRRSQVLQAFAELSRDLTLDTDPLVLIRRTQEVVLDLLPAGYSMYFEPEDGRWHLKSQVGRAPSPSVQALLDTSHPFEAATNLLTPYQSGEVHFQDEYDPQTDQLSGDDEYPGATVVLPVVVEGQTRGVLGFALYTVRSWSREDRAVLETVGHQLTLALERAEQTQRLAVQNAELEARTRALEGFSHLTQDLATQGDPRALVRRAQEVVMTLLTPGYALYYERDGDCWRNRVQVGDTGNAELQTFIDAGPLVGVTPSVDIPWTTREPYYQDSYARGSDTPADMVQHVSAAASLPVLKRGEVVGVFIAVLFEQRQWTPTDRVVLETVVNSLSLALERAEGMADLARRTEELARSNAELEQFAYIASHDLQAPIRAVTSFAGVIDQRYGERLDDRGRLYLRQIVEGGEHMKRLVDDLLAFSRVHTERRDLLPVDSGAVFDTVTGRLRPETGARAAGVTRGDLPVVLADAQQLDQLLQNLVSNGLKYQREGAVPQVHVSAVRDGELWRFAVADNGIGIEPQYFERIFVIFQRLHGRERYEGTGIGLAVCKKIVERHGGRLWLESTLGRGSTFFFTLPAG